MPCRQNNLAALAQQGYSIPESAFGTPGAPGTPCSRNCAAANPQLRANGGTMMPDGRNVHFWQDSWVPWNTRINPILVEPEQFSLESYAFYQQAYNAGFMPVRNCASTSGQYATLPIQYHAGQYAYRNPGAGVFR